MTNAKHITTTINGHTFHVVANFIVTANGLEPPNISNPEPPDAGEVELCRRFIATHARKTRTIRRRRSSYGLKHTVERSHGYRVYVSNGSFILAAILEGHTVEPASGPNTWFNLSVLSYGQREGRQIHRPKEGPIQP